MTREEFDILRFGRQKYELLKTQREETSDLEVQKEINKEITEILKLRIKLQRELKEIRSIKVNDALHMFYISAQPMYIIADNLNITKRHVRRLLRKGESILIQIKERN